ncbi:uncharacterized protein LOC114416321 [Glycine soja]|uniref:uncharacterized protein LOC114416321 n=1 Tax=Glycine soja TaxID=3848 RepID=UPI00103E721C|nr:uncharacterized protein LOC114416321 [Glycine soja]
MGSSQTPPLKKRFYQVKIKSLEVTSLQELRGLIGQLQQQAFHKTYGKIWDLATIEVSAKAITSLTQYYDQSLRCFTFEDFQLVPTVEEFEEILGCPLEGRKPYLLSGFYPSMPRIAKIVRISAQELDRVKQNRNGVIGIPRKYLEERARALAGQNEWLLFIDVLALLIFRVLVSNLFRQDVRHTCPLQSHRSCTENREANWDQLLANIERVSINWFPRWKERRSRILVSCGEFPNVPLMGTRGCINYNHVLAIRQLGYPMRGAPSVESLTPFITRGFSDPNARVLQGVRKAWEVVQRKDKELRGSNNGNVRAIIGG